MNKNKEKAFELRLKGYSYNEIKTKVGVPKSTQSGWFKNVILSENARSRLNKRVYRRSVRSLVRRNKNQTKLAVERAKQIKKKAKDEIGKLSYKELKLIGISLYWGEGYKRIQKGTTTHMVSLSNSDPKLIAIMMEFFRKVCLVQQDRFRLQLRIYPHMNEKAVKLFWSNLTKIPLSRFHKTSYSVSRLSQHKRPINRLPYGTVQIRVSDTKLFYKITGWIEGVKAHLRQ